MAYEKGLGGSAPMSATMLVFIAALLLGGCADDADPGPPAPDRDAAPGLERTSIERKGDLAGTLVVDPTAAEPGAVVRVAVENAGEMTIYFGICNRIQRRDHGAWEAATEAVYGDPSPACRAIQLSVEPGERVGPRYNDDLTDAIRLPRDLEPGFYRVTKQVHGENGSDSQLTLEAIFKVRSVGGQT